MRAGRRGLEFICLLTKDEKYCAQLGKCVLAAARLEAELARYLASEGRSLKHRNAMLGQLIAGKKATRLQENMLPALAMILKQRNYLSHNIYRLFACSIEETILPRSQLLDSDIDCFTERARQLAENLDVLADSIAKRIGAATA